MMNLYYDPEIRGVQHTLNPEESSHCIKVMRGKKHDLVFLTNGKGDLFKAMIEDPHPRKCLLKIIEKTENPQPRPFRLHIAIAPTKQIERFEWFLEKATEAGIDEVTPLICERSERRILKPERLSKVLVSAMKQSVKTILPRLNPSTSFEQFIQSSGEGEKFLANCKEEKVFLSDLARPGENIIMLVGPEGDFTENEIIKAEHFGFRSISLGKSRLRTETAGLSACIMLNMLNRF
jgi:16S rRNA (uracil1498-N3)-methyltransferase